GCVVKAGRSDKAVLQTEEGVVYAGHLLRRNGAPVELASAIGENVSDDCLMRPFGCRGILSEKADEQGGERDRILHAHAILNRAGVVFRPQRTAYTGQSFETAEAAKKAW